MTLARSYILNCRENQSSSLRVYVNRRESSSHATLTLICSQQQWYQFISFNPPYLTLMAPTFPKNIKETAVTKVFKSWRVFVKQVPALRVVSIDPIDLIYGHLPT